MRKIGQRAEVKTPAAVAAGIAILGLCCSGVSIQGAAVENPAADIRRDATVAAIESALPCVVNVGTETLVERRDTFDDLMREWWGPYYRRRAPEAHYSLGSGVIIDEAGYILTNEHVVGRANRVWVQLSDGRQYETEKISGTSRSDVALLKIRAKPGEKFTAVKFAEDDDLLLGETVIALGNPFGLGGSVSRGILSSKARRVPKENEPLNVSDWLQTDAAINPGNSGGPLVNLRGELIGLNVAVYREGHGIGFAIPISRVSTALAEFFSPESVKALWFGARVKPSSVPLAISLVQPGSPADRAGLKGGDHILSVAGKAARSFVEFSREINAAGTARDVEIVIRRGGERKTVTVKLIPEKDFFNPALIEQKLGISVQEISRELAGNIGFPYDTGFVISNVETNSPAASAKLERSFIVLAVDGSAPEDVVEFAKMIYAKNKGDEVKLNLAIRVRRGNFIRFEEGVTTVKVR
jgi:serine protease Do